jgi:hypothetical protein
MFPAMFQAMFRWIQGPIRLEELMKTLHPESWEMP